ncbi:unnamed protein product, partial [Linum tenue]
MFSVLGEISEGLLGGAEGSEADGSLLCAGPGEGGGDGGREHHLRHRKPWVDAQRRVRGREEAERH